MHVLQDSALKFCPTSACSLPFLDLCCSWGRHGMHALYSGPVAGTRRVQDRTCQTCPSRLAHCAGKHSHCTAAQCGTNHRSHTHSPLVRCADLRKYCKAKSSQKVVASRRKYLCFLQCQPPACFITVDITKFAQWEVQDSTSYPVGGCAQAATRVGCRFRGCHLAT